MGKQTRHLILGREFYKKQRIYVLMTLHMKDELGLLTFLDKLTIICKLIPGRINLKLKKSAPKGSSPYVIIW